MPLIGTLPNNIQDGQLIDAVPVMANFNYIVSQVNANVPASVPVTTPITTWTPVLSFGGGSTGITYSTQAGSYVRIGSIIHFTFAIVLTSKGSSTGVIQIAGLPFPCNAAWPTGGTNIFITYSDFLTYTGTALAYLTAGSSSFAVYNQITAPGNPTQLTDAAVTNNFQLVSNGVYSL